jgi:hypothetical protein
MLPIAIAAIVILVILITYYRLWPHYPYRTKDGLTTTFHSRNEGPNFMKVWIREMIQFAKIIYEDNKYPATPGGDVPQKNEVVIFVYNSAKFNTNIIFKELHNPPE